MRGPLLERYLIETDSHRVAYSFLWRPYTDHGIAITRASCDTHVTQYGSFGRNEMVGIVLLVFVFAVFAGMTWIMD